ncbi:MAG: PEP-CTERM sorting domain-containing protein [Planctomycetota bacterium]
MNRNQTNLFLTAGVAALFAASHAGAQPMVVVDDNFADGITDNGPGQIGFNTTSSGSALDLAQPAGPVDFATGNSGRTIHGLFDAQTLSAFGDVLDVTFDFTTPTTIAADNSSTNEDFKFGLFSTAASPLDFTGSISASSGSPEAGLNSVAGFFGEIDNINASGTDLGIRTHNVNNLVGSGADSPNGQFMNSNDGFDFIAGGDDDIINLLPNTDYVGSISVAFTDATLTTLDITIGMMDAAGIAFSDSFTRTVSIADDPGTSIGVNTTTFDLLAFHATSGAFGGTGGIAPGSSNTGEANNGIDISNVTVTFTPVPEPGSLALLGAGACLLATRRRTA